MVYYTHRLSTHPLPGRGMEIEMNVQALTATPEQLAVLIEYCRNQIQQYAYGLPAELQGVVEAISGPCFDADDEEA